MVTVAIVGRPNVGKSTLFNRLVGERNAIIEDEPGVTRDRIYGSSDWNGRHFHIIDTGGFIPGSEDTMEKAIREQAMIAMEEADSIIFMVDGKEGITRFDRDIGVLLRTTDKPVTLVVNKCDNHVMDHNSYEFYELGLGDPFPISANNGRSTGDFMDKLVETFPIVDYDEDDNRLKIALVGRPNAGKSSLTNALLGKERNIVTDIPGTTRDSIDSVVKYHGEEIVLIDTAGLRRKSKVDENIEKWSMVRTHRAIDRCDIGVVILDAERGFEEQDKRIIQLLNDARKGIIIAVNKWDLIDNEESDTAHKMKKSILEEVKTFHFVPVIFTSATEKTRIFKIIEIAKEIKARREKRISTGKLNKVLIDLFERTPAPAVRGYDLRINYITQVGTEPPLFTVFLNQPQLLPDSYKRFIERQIRENFDLEGTPISLLFRKKNKKWEDR
ncbi:MAG: ribosome biogenesis GTPase Der [Candidatus Kapaibacterium sp.]|nr:ribosome biogenesis GTPase Der [Ignavibacteriota bacterium]MCB9220470.1 ribosome biogenesis GTPase Der [Ignavibacteria bacterium]